MRGLRCGDTTRARVGLRASRQRRHLKLARKSSAGRVNGLELDFEPGLPNQSDELRAPPILASQRPRRRGTGRVGDWCDPDRARRRASEPARPSAPRLDPPTSPGVITSHLNTSETSETVACGPGDMDAAAALSDALTADRPVGIRAAAMSDDVDELARLLDAGVPVDYADGAPGTPLLSALAHGASDAAAFLVAAGCALDAEDPATGGGVIHAAARSPDPSSSALVLRACHAACVPMDARDHAGRTPLEIAMRHRPRAPNSAAVSRGAYRVLVAILDAGASPDVPFSAGAHPLAVAVAAGARDVVELLLERGACPDGEPPSGYGRGPADAPDLKPAGTGIEPTTSERANARARSAIVRGARAGATTPRGSTGARMRAGGELERTPLLLAVSERRPDLVTTLMDAGADPGTRGAVRRRGDSRGE